jgi:hypothetical protein
MRNAQALNQKAGSESTITASLSPGQRTWTAVMVVFRFVNVFQGERRFCAALIDRDHLKSETRFRRLSNAA